MKPCFITDLSSQHLDFGAVAIGASSRQIVLIRNILCKHIDQSFVSKLKINVSDEPIQISSSVLSPVGPFACFNPQNLQLDAENLLKLPIAFTPTQEKTVRYINDATIAIILSIISFTNNYH